jgi:hypothetical protein
LNAIRSTTSAAMRMATRKRNSPQVEDGV